MTSTKKADIRFYHQAESTSHPTLVVLFEIQSTLYCFLFPFANGVLKADLIL